MTAFRARTLAEIVSGDRNGLSVVSTFSGCGGSCLGFEAAGFEVLFASEFVESARETYAANHPDVPIDGRDIRKLSVEEVLATIEREPGEVDVLEGSPPCASFSMAGSRSGAWGKVKPYSDTQQRTDDLFFEFVRLLEGIRPRAFVAENVPGLATGVAKGYFLEIRAALRGAGYDVDAKILDAQLLGVAQRRKRLIFVGTRSDLAIAPPFPDPFSYRYSVGEVLDGVAPPTEVAGEMRDPETNERIDLDGMAIAYEAKVLGPGEGSDRYLNLIRADPESPCPTVTQTGGTSRGTASVVAADGRRKFTLGELRRVCGFPDDFVLSGSYRQRWERLGRAVPPPMMEAVARRLAEVIR